MTMWQWIKSVLFSTSRADEAAAREEYDLPDRGRELLQRDGSIHPGSPPAQAGQSVLDEFEPPR